ncbi:MAG: hypothetical protein HWN65_13885 [Candidatus Helarchaeota archaeon]|nr:hypothetical protein [Candidatus Helarchaeota archaeon]
MEPLEITWGEPSECVYLFSKTSETTEMIAQWLDLKVNEVKLILTEVGRNPLIDGAFDRRSPYAVYYDFIPGPTDYIWTGLNYQMMSDYS